MASREQVYRAINQERDYQKDRWSHNKGQSGEMIEIERTVEDFITYMANYLSDARIALNDGNTVAALDAVRKITALGVACMEQNGVTTRPAEMTVRARKKSVG